MSADRLPIKIWYAEVDHDDSESRTLMRIGFFMLLTLGLSGCGMWQLMNTGEFAMTENRANADVVQVQAVEQADGSWTFAVTVAHPDTGWDDYADGWDVVTPTGEVLKPDPGSPFTRLLLHPHENEQPFTRSQSGIVIPGGVTQVRVRAHDLVDGFGGQEVVVDLTKDSGAGFTVQRAPAT